jgi:transposase
MDKFEKARDIGPWLGTTPKQDQSGDIDKQCHITKAGSPFMRRLLVESAQMILREGSIDTDLKLKGLRICVRGGKIAKRKAITAIARSLAVLMVAILKKPDSPYVPLSEQSEKELLFMRTAM